MTADSTCGGGVKFLGPTLNNIRQFYDSRLTLIDNREYVYSPGCAANDYANSNWNMSVKLRARGLSCA